MPAVATTTTMGGKEDVPVKKLTSITTEDQNIKFNYDSNGKLIKVTNGTEYADFTWNANSIIVTNHDDNAETSEISLVNGKISKTSTKYADEDEPDYENITYSGNYLTQMQGYKNLQYTWENGNITKCVKTYEDEDENVTYTCSYYTDKQNTHNLFFINELEDINLYRITCDSYGYLLLLVQPNLIGTPNKNFLKSVNDGEVTTNYTYEFDSDGYPTKITATSSDSTNPTIYNLTWE